MLRELLKVIAYLSILTSTYSSHLTKDTYTRFRRPLAYTDSISADQHQQQHHQQHQQQHHHKQQSVATSGDGKGGGGGGSGGNSGSSSSSSSGGSESYSYQLYNPKPPQMKYEPILNELTSKTLHRMSDKVIVNNQNKPSYNKLASNLNSSINNSNNITTITMPSKSNSRNNNKIKNNYNQNDSNRLKTANSNYYPQQQQQQQLQQLHQQQQQHLHQQQQQHLHAEATQDGRELEQMFGAAYAKYAMAKIHQMPISASLNLDQEHGVLELKKKRAGGGANNGGGNGGTSNGAEEMPEVNDAMVSQMLPRATRRQREYDVPLIQCPPATDGMERFACPTPDRQGRYRCIDDHVLCDGFIDCPEGADEDRQACMFYKTTKAHLDVLADALLRWARGR